MEDSNIFEKLVSDMNSSERKNMLNKLKDVKNISSEPLQQGIERQEIINYNQEYKRMSIIQKLLILLQQLFTGKDPIKLVENTIIIEVKSVEFLIPVHNAQIISYLKLAKKPLGFLINFNVPLIKEGINRFFFHTNQN